METNNKMEDLTNKEEINEGIVDAVEVQQISKYLTEKYVRVDSSEIVEKYSFFKKLFSWLGEKSTEDACFREKEDQDRYLILLYTKEHEYSIHLNPSWMGGGANCRYHRPLEDWTRGNDLLDGTPSEHLLDALVYEMLAYELVPIGK